MSEIFLAALLMWSNIPADCHPPIPFSPEIEKHLAENMGYHVWLKNCLLQQMLYVYE